MKRLGWIFLIAMTVCHAAALRAGEEESLIPASELQALDRAISRELNSGNMGSQTLGDLYRLKNRLIQLRQSAKSETARALEPLDSGDSQRQQLNRLEAEAAAGGRAAKRSLALYYLFLNEPEKALSQWRDMGKATEHDLSYLLISAYLEFALGEYNTGHGNLEKALRFMETRSSLAVSTPILCDTVAGYRIYAERGNKRVMPGEDVLLYVEIDGVEFSSLNDGSSECKLMFGLKLYDDNQSVVWAESNYGEYAPTFSGPIRDLHAALTWRVPNDLSPGRYHLTVEAVEDSTKRRGEAVLDFTVEKRDTNAEKRPTAGLAPMPSPQLPQSYYDAQNAFPGAPFVPNPNPSGGMRDTDMYKQQFDLLQQYERGLKAE